MRFWKAMANDKAGMLRLLALGLICAAFLILARRGFAPGTRAATLLGTGIVFAMAAIYELAARGRSERAMAWAIAIVMGICGLAYELMRIFDPAPPQWHGALIAGQLPAPANGCSGRPELAGRGHLLMIFGRDGVIGQGDGPFLPVRIGSCPALNLRRGEGGLLIDGFGYDADNNVVYRIRHNVFEMVLRGFLREDRSEKNTLKIVDEKARSWLTVSYLNTNTVRIAGIFGCGDTKNVTIGEDSVQAGGATVSGPNGVCRVLETGSQAGFVYQSRADVRF